MTEIEAIERVLAGNPFTQCAPCQGTGKTGSPMWGDQALCKSCEGMASYPDPAYSEACRILGRTVPKNVLGLWRQARNRVDLQKLTPVPVSVSLEDMKDLVFPAKESK